MTVVNHPSGSRWELMARIGQVAVYRETNVLSSHFWVGSKDAPLSQGMGTFFFSHEPRDIFFTNMLRVARHVADKEEQDV